RPSYAVAVPFGCTWRGNSTRAGCAGCSVPLVQPAPHLGEVGMTRMTRTTRTTQVAHQPLRPAPRARIARMDRAVYFLRSRGTQVVVLALVANTMVAQLLYNSAGQLVLGSHLLLGYLLFSAVCSTVAFALFEISTIFQLHDLMSLDATIKAEIEAGKL